VSDVEEPAEIPLIEDVRGPSVDPMLRIVVRAANLSQTAKTRAARQMVRQALANDQAVHHAEAAADLDEPPHFIHLRDVTIVEGTCHLRVPWWRGRLDAVDGWVSGSIA
jgi:hypothetical protein